MEKLFRQIECGKSREGINCFFGSLIWGWLFEVDVFEGGFNWIFDCALNEVLFD